MIGLGGASHKQQLSWPFNPGPTAPETPEVGSLPAPLLYPSR